MNAKNTTRSCNLDALFDFAMGRLSQNEAEATRRHAENCARCGRELERLEAFRLGADELRRVEFAESGAGAIWTVLEKEARRGAERFKVRSAWRTLSRPVLLPAGALAALLLISVFAYLIIHSAVLQPGTTTAKAGSLHDVGPAKQQQLVFSLGAEVTLQAESSAAVRVANPKAGVVYLARGMLQAQVDQLAETQSFEVHTDDAVVAVKGTVFEVLKNSPAATNVAVVAGTVWITPAGRNRDKVVLTAGQSAAILGETAYLAELRQSGEKALAEADYAAGVTFFDRYLASSSAPDNSEVEFLLAEASEHAGNLGQAIQLYQGLARSGGALRAENAFAALAAAQKRLGREAQALATWKRYVERFPDGAYAQDALYDLARSECATTRGANYQRFIERYAGTGTARELQRSCGRKAK